MKNVSSSDLFYSKCHFDHSSGNLTSGSNLDHLYLGICFSCFFPCRVNLFDQAHIFTSLISDAFIEVLSNKAQSASVVHLKDVTAATGSGRGGGDGGGDGEGVTQGRGRQ